MDKKLSWGDYIEFRLHMGDRQLAKAKNLYKKKAIKRKYASMVVWNIVIEAAMYGSEIQWKGKKKQIEEKYMGFFKLYAKAITWLLRGSQGNMAMLKADIKMVQATLDKRKKRFATQLLAADYLNNTSDRNMREYTVKELYQSIIKQCLEDYEIEGVDYSKECQQTKVEELPEPANGITWEFNYDIVIFVDRSAQVSEWGFRVKDQRMETGFAAVVTTQSIVTEELRVIETKREICGGRVNNFDMETIAIKKLLKQIKRNRVGDVLIRSDSTTVIQRIKNMRAGLDQVISKEVKKITGKMKGNVYIGWVNSHDGDKGNKKTDREADRVVKEVKSKYQKIITILYLSYMISIQAARYNYPGVPSKYYLFNYTK